jgi:hypothetical protein
MAQAPLSPAFLQTVTSPELFRCCSVSLICFFARTPHEGGSPFLVSAGAGSKNSQCSKTDDVPPWSTGWDSHVKGQSLLSAVTSRRRPHREGRKYRVPSLLTPLPETRWVQRLSRVTQVVLE